MPFSTGIHLVNKALIFDLASLYSEEFVNISPLNNLLYSLTRGSITNWTNMGLPLADWGALYIFLPLKQYSPHKNCQSTRGFIPNFYAIFLENPVRLNAQQSKALEKATLPFSGQKNNSFSYCSNKSSSKSNTSSFVLLLPLLFAVFEVSTTSPSKPNVYFDF